MIREDNVQKDDDFPITPTTIVSPDTFTHAAAKKDMQNSGNTIVPQTQLKPIVVQLNPLDLDKIY